jgi:hypothetical protein
MPSAILTGHLQRRIHKCRRHYATTFMMRVELAVGVWVCPRRRG